MIAVARSFWKPVLIAAGAAIFVGALGATLTDTGAWYRALLKPWWQPPDWLFGPAWTVIFALAAMSAVYAWRGARSTSQREWVVGLFALNGFLNIVWSTLFFAARRPDWALVEVPLLWLSILIAMAAFWRWSRTASLYLLPYVFWVAFAAYLNWTVVQLNAPFD